MPGGDERLTIEALPATRIAEAVGVLSRGMRDNPNNIAAFGEDPARRHVGPLAVEPHLQGRLIGSHVLGEHCRQLDEQGLGGYLETDEPENVRLCERFGYRVVAQASVIGVPNWFMWRENAPPPA